MCEACAVINAHSSSPGAEPKIAMAVLQDGNVINGTWKKDSRTGRTIFSTKKGVEVTFNPGRIWIEVVSKDTAVAY